MHKLPPPPHPAGEVHITPGTKSTTDIFPRMREHRIFCNSDPIESFLELNLIFSIWMYGAKHITGDSPWQAYITNK